ncbi:MAG: TIGR00645 family protein [Paracoccaceae bacterium]|nr:TIGR00645 family protein [Paracoccaceae bacterium]
MQDFIENVIERSIFASRWLLAPVYLVLSISLAFVAIKVVQEFLHFVPHVMENNLKELMLFLLHIVDLALVGNLILMIIFAGYENFVSKISVADSSEDKPNWMGKVDFSELKLKLIASIVAISGINLLESFMDIEHILVVGGTDQLYWMVLIHVVFIGSGVFLAIMDFVASKSHH